MKKKKAENLFHVEHTMSGERYIRSFVLKGPAFAFAARLITVEQMKRSVDKSDPVDVIHYVPADPNVPDTKEDVLISNRWWKRVQTWRYSRDGSIVTASGAA
jgi:hypothetical protein